MEIFFSDKSLVLLVVLDIIFYLYIGLYHGIYRWIKPRSFLNEVKQPPFIKILTRGVYAAQKDEELKTLQESAVLNYYKKSGVIRFLISTFVFLSVFFIFMTFK